jgi:hypothetical protein
LVYGHNVTVKANNSVHISKSTPLFAVEKSKEPPSMSDKMRLGQTFRYDSKLMSPGGSSQPSSNEGLLS